MLVICWSHEKMPGAIDASPAEGRAWLATMSMPRPIRQSTSMSHFQSTALILVRVAGARQCPFLSACGPADRASI